VLVPLGTFASIVTDVSTLTCIVSHMKSLASLAANTILRPQAHGWLI
jgi:hypothetical protein